MKIVIAPDSFKESLSAYETACAIERGFHAILPDAEYIKLPMADGGEGTVQSLVDATGGYIINHVVTGPLGDPVDAFFGMLGDGETAVIEMAAASGLHLVPQEKRNPLLTTSRGTGELMLAALDQGAKHVIIGLGGSATNDGGVGMMQGLGAVFLDQAGQELSPGGGTLHQLASIDLTGLDPRLQSIRLEAACDVDNPLTGERGASAVFGPQKGADEHMVQVLDKNLAHFAQIAEKQFNVSFEDAEGAGAAGGLGASLLGFLHADLQRGIDIVLKAVQFNDVIKEADLVVTGEGRIDQQTIYGKTPIGVAKAAKQYHLPVIGIAGSLSKDSAVVHEHGIDALFSIVPGVTSLSEAMRDGAIHVERTARNIAAVISIGKNK
ncbi:glycerate kinase [Bacillus pumilus]|uniref:glycerate kinase n=1 Tax=Bacillus pumilus TaxID=1408 RepID=UPI0007176EF4|nr:glycerate kinase [Bacillus pumilus]AMM99240.1 glycerate kinase [Bacillus pumilus]KRU17490.1 glycerate kinase [Bacillus pumilus]MCY7678913.1 glycerate kinase [Bacillus pumilus]MDH3149716.1 glycerate kinase [Bacillus pumilus]